LSFFCCNVQSRVEIFRVCIDLCSRLEEENDNVDVAETRGDVKRGLLLLKIKQKLNSLKMYLACREQTEVSD
jgi:hypothetical protein